jgi:hypothetical protein
MFHLSIRWLYVTEDDIKGLPSFQVWFSLVVSNAILNGLTVALGQNNFLDVNMYNRLVVDILVVCAE